MLSLIKLLGKGLFILSKNNHLMILNLFILLMYYAIIKIFSINLLDLEHLDIMVRLIEVIEMIMNAFTNIYLFILINELINQMKKYLYRSNRLPIQTLKWLTPVEKMQELQRSQLPCNSCISGFYFSFFVSHHLQMYICNFYFKLYIKIYEI